MPDFIKSLFSQQLPSETPTLTPALMDNPVRWMEEQHQGSKYRASCDACNEAKVRCSRTKPTCTRCQKSQIICIYGLSRRSHKTAARIGCSVPSQQQKQQQQEQTQQQEQEQQEQSAQPPNSTTASQMESIQSLISSTNGNYSTPPFSVGFSEFSLYTSMIASPTSGPSPIDSAVRDSGKSFEFGLDVSDFSELGLVFPFDDTTVDPAFPISIPGSRGTSSGDSAIGGYTLGSYSSSIVTNLASNPLLLAKKGVSLDIQLSQLKTATSFAEECLQASDSDWDDMSPLAISMLVGSILTGFENSLEEIETTGDFQASSPQQAAAMQPQFKWGALHIDNEDELVLLKRHMWLIQFQRVEIVLHNLHNRIKGMKHEQMDQATAQKILASNNIHLWFEQRAQLVKQRFSSSSASRFHSA